LNATKKIKAIPDSTFFDAYATYAQMQEFLQELSAAFPSITNLVNVGTSVDGNAITGIQIGPDKSKPNLVINALQHAREWITPMTVAYIAQSLCQNYTNGVPEITAILDEFYITIIPIVNPDGYLFTWSNDRLWRKNRRQNPNSSCYGVDNNRNWGYEWNTGGSSPFACSDTYMGPSAFSEPEETSVANYITSLGANNVVGYIDVHAYGDLFMFPYGYSCTAEVSNYAAQQAAGVAFANAVEAVHGEVFTVGPVCQTIYQASGGSNDWTYGVANVPYSYAAELRGNSFILPPENIIPSGQEVYAGVQAWANYIYANM